ncbi:NAD(P)-dependent oxidoreductase [Providencia rettgeri]|uniref:NAD(P)H-binding protein n=1 Tax=Providencia rettgeri TaxID=587 RepID=A0AB35LCK8_PRORE|nr:MULTISPECIES: NAD(P)H-binding protein [Providencia]AWS52435.1 3-beta hydroxysteroid dehydrogenase [Providencia rettgeri]EHZ7764417.1 NAD(P)H-binding protein [Providencia rettgeri]EIJ7167559.1 NAD(P)H-binding protein [Providencia rettgeri]EJD6046641.1 NAD(P)H-binding protein [Providencia rettgeri]EKT55085.1 NAD-dependent epimerase/dehydratase [Providencia rettgeri Dmel1]
MKISIIGATGFVGRALVAEALLRHHQVTAISRHSNQLSQHAHLITAAGDITDIPWLTSRLKGQDVVISAFNGGWQNPNLYQDTVAGNLAILHAVQKSMVKRFIVVGGAGSLKTTAGIDLIDSPDFPAEIKPGAQAMREFKNQLQSIDSLDWTYVSPAAMLEEGERTETFRLGGNQLLMNGNTPAKISVEDFAVAILDEVNNSQFIRQQFTAAY